MNTFKNFLIALFFTWAVACFTSTTQAQPFLGEAGLEERIQKSIECLANDDVAMTERMTSNTKCSFKSASELREYLLSPASDVSDVWINHDEQHFANRYDGDGEPPEGDASSALSTSFLIDGDTIVAQTLEEVRDSRVPDWVQSAVLLHHGYDSWDSVPNGAMVERIPTLTMLASVTSGVVDVYSMRNGCQVDSRLAERGDTIPIFINSERTEIFDEAGLDVSLTTSAVASGLLTYSVEYTETYLVCPWGSQPGFIEFNEVSIDSLIFLQSGEMHVQGDVNSAFNGDVLRHTLDLWTALQNLWFATTDVDLALHIRAELGLVLDAQDASNFEASFILDGVLSYKWACDLGGCENTLENTNLEQINIVVENGSVFASDQQAMVTPFVDLRIASELTERAGAIDIMQAHQSVVAALPTNYYLYAGNDCSDADGDGMNELVITNIADLNAQFYAYLDWDLPDLRVDGIIPIALETFGNPIIELIPPYTVGGFQVPVRQRHLDYLDYVNGGSTGMQPVVQLGAQTAVHGGASVRQRDCYPLHSESEYELSWGDNTANYVGSGGYIEHTWATTGPKNVRARIRSDALGRDIDSPWISVATTVVGDAAAPSAPQYPTVGTNQILEPNQLITVSWQNQNIGPFDSGYPDSFKIYRSVTSDAAGAQPVSNAQFTSEVNGLYTAALVNVGSSTGVRYFHAQSCNAVGCSPLATAPEPVEVAYDAQIPATPHNLEITGNSIAPPGSTKSITWQNAVSEFDTFAPDYPERFLVYRGQAPDGSDAQLLDEVTGWHNSATVNVGLSTGLRYFHVAACNHVGCSLSASTPTPVDVQVPTPPGRPSIVTVPNVLSEGEVFSFDHTKPSRATYYRAAIGAVSAPSSSLNFRNDLDGNQNNGRFRIQAPNTEPCEIPATRRLHLKACNAAGCGPADSELITLLPDDVNGCDIDPFG